MARRGRVAAAPRPPARAAGPSSGRLTGYLFLLPALVLIGRVHVLPVRPGRRAELPELGRRWPRHAVGRHRQLREGARRHYLLGLAEERGRLRAARLPPRQRPLAGDGAGGQQRTRGARTFYRIAYYLPGVFSVVVVGLMFAWLLQPSVGIAESRARRGRAECSSSKWLTDPGTALPSVAAVYVWYHWGFGFLLFLAGLQGVPRELYEAASIDGAGAWARFRYITWPQLIPVTTIISVLTLLGGAADLRRRSR